MCATGGHLRSPVHRHGRMQYLHLCGRNSPSFDPLDGLFNSRGSNALLDHGKGVKHKQIADGVNNRLGRQPTMATYVNRNVEEGRKGGSEEENDERGAEGEEGEVVEVARREVVGSGGLRSVPTVRSLEDKKLSAEIRWVLKMVDSGFSYNSIEDLVPVLQMMAPDSLILKSLQLKRTKAEYAKAKAMLHHT